MNLSSLLRVDGKPPSTSKPPIRTTNLREADYTPIAGHITAEQPALVVVPFSVLGNWQKELRPLSLMDDGRFTPPSPASFCPPISLDVLRLADYEAESENVLFSVPNWTAPEESVIYPESGAPPTPDVRGTLAPHWTRGNGHPPCAFRSTTAREGPWKALVVQNPSVTS